VEALRCVGLLLCHATPEERASELFQVILQKPWEVMIPASTESIEKVFLTILDLGNEKIRYFDQ